MRGKAAWGMIRIASALTGMLALMLLAAGCTGGEQAGSAGTAARPGGVRTRQVTRTR